MNIFVTGCCGYIGSHTCVELLNAGYNVIGLDNFSNSKKDVLEKIEKITTKKIKFYEGNMLNKEILSKIFHENKIDCVIDFAAYKAVGESVAKPVEYYINNVSSVLTLLSVMKENNCKRLVFSSSATVYGDPEVVPITEDAKTGGTTNPYGTSKLFVEQSGLIGEDPKGIPANLMPYISKVASGKLECLSIFGDDYDTKDGTGVRDYIHVVDLAIGHIKAVEKLEKEKQGLYIYNLGTGEGYSVLEMVHAFEKANNLKVPYKIVERRSGDIAMCYSSPKKAKEELGFSCKKTLDDMVRDAYHYEQVNKDL